jgi:hypothetical protein
MDERDKVLISEYIKKLDLRVRDVKEIVQDFSEVYAVISEWEKENLKKSKKDQESRQVAYIKLDNELIEEKRRKEKENKSLTDYELIEDNKVMSTLLLLEEHSRSLYEFYAMRPSSDAFRCTSLYKTYSLNESEDFKDAIELFDTITSNNRTIIL